ncbi:hypothetical protein RQP46_008213 [Phenoliferia psychrophenolica]
MITTYLCTNKTDVGRLPDALAVTVASEFPGRTPGGISSLYKKELSNYLKERPPWTATERSQLELLRMRFSKGEADWRSITEQHFPGRDPIEVRCAFHDAETKSPRKRVRQTDDEQDTKPFKLAALDDISDLSSGSDPAPAEPGTLDPSQSSGSSSSFAPHPYLTAFDSIPTLQTLPQDYEHCDTTHGHPRPAFLIAAGGTPSTLAPFNSTMQSSRSLRPRNNTEVEVPEEPNVRAAVHPKESPPTPNPKRTLRARAVQ